jgi:hypothetical protein
VLPGLGTWMHVPNHPSEAARWRRMSLGDARRDDVNEMR